MSRIRRAGGIGIGLFDGGSHQEGFKKSDDSGKAILSPGNDIIQIQLACSPTSCSVVTVRADDAFTRDGAIIFVGIAMRDPLVVFFAIWAGIFAGSQ